MIVDWNFYVSRKRINVKEWLERKNIQDYDTLVEVTKKLGIETPSEEKVSKYFAKPEINKNDEKTKKHVPEHDIVATEISKKPEPALATELEKEVPEDTEQKQTRKRVPRRKRKLVKDED
tara:strand:+ start:8333 stop:8692 length:360 start_codon:yes stop_codon:yes gene_type:complete